MRLRRDWRPVVVVLLLLQTPVAHAADTIEIIEYNGSPGNRIDLVIIGDGYTAAQAEQFRQDVDDLVVGLFGSSPLGAYQGAFNLYRVVTESAESGADHPSLDIWVDTYFDGQFEYMGIDRLTNADTGKVVTVVSGLVPEVDSIILILNDPTYGGAGGSVAMASTHPAAVQIVVHELGHTFGGLADEYTDALPGVYRVDPEPNIELDTDFDAIKWNLWIESTTPLPTPVSVAVDDYHPVGAYEGARYFETGIYRPAPNCIMRDLAYHYCDVCRESMTLGIHLRVDAIDAVDPLTGLVAVDLGQPASLPVVFTVELVPWTADRTITWELDGSLVGTGSTYLFDPLGSGLPSGTYVLACRVTDTSGWIRNDPNGLSESERRWTILVTGSTPDAFVPQDAGPSGEERPGCDCQSQPTGGGGRGLLGIGLIGLLCYGFIRWVGRRRRTAS